MNCKEKFILIIIYQGIINVDILLYAIMLLSLVSSLTTHLDGVVSINLLINLSCSSFSYGVYFKTGNDTSLLFLFFSTIGLLLYLKFIL